MYYCVSINFYYNSGFHGFVLVENKVLIIDLELIKNMSCILIEPDIFFIILILDWDVCDDRMGVR